MSSLPPESAGASLVYLTAHQAIHQWDDLLSKCITLITGASGGVGVAMVQLAKALGHTVVGLSRSQEKALRLRELGADLTLDPNQPTWPKQLAEKFGKQAVNLAVDNIGGPAFNDLMNVMAYNGRISVVGVRDLSTSQEQLDAYRRIENAEAYPGGPPRTIDLTSAESERSERAFHDDPR